MISQSKIIKEMNRVCKPGGKILVIDVTPDNAKKDAYNHVEKLRDSSHAGALTPVELKRMIEDIGLVDIKIEHQDLGMDLETILYSSSSNPEDKDKIIKLFKEDLTADNLGMSSHIKDGRIYFYFPVSMLIASKRRWSEP